jgi:Thiamine pyrophosphate enzyme, C-terminal TPP binding domain
MPISSSNCARPSRLPETGRPWNAPPVAQELSQDVRYDKVAEAFGGHGELVTDPNEIRPALERAFASGVPACINVITDPKVRYGHSGAATHKRRSPPPAPLSGVGICCTWPVRGARCRRWRSDHHRTPRRTVITGQERV